MSYEDSFLKRATDVIVALAASVIALPLVVIGAIALKLESKGPVFFLQDRVGKGRKNFKIYKLRTMVANAPNIGPVLTQKSDPRITKVGALLRRTSVDELPQIINVLKGEMSVVGPRPEVPSIVNAEYNEVMMEVFRYKPGMTGIAQISGRQELDVEPKVMMDINYYSKATWWSDMKIIFKTPGALLSNRGNM